MLTTVLAFLQRLINILLDAYIAVLFVRMIVDWVLVLSRRTPHGAWGRIVSVLYDLTEPPLRWLRRWIRPIPMGGVSLDVAYLVLWVGIGVVQWLVNFLFSLLVWG